MKRYCCVTEADKIRFQKNVKDWCYDVNFFQLVFEQILLQEEEEEKQISEGNYESVLELNKLGNAYTIANNFLKKIKCLPNSYEFMLDIYNEIYLSVVYLKQEKENFYIEEKNSENDGLNISIKNTIDTRKRGCKKGTPYDDFIFDIAPYTSAAKNEKIPCFGSGVAKAWLSSRSIKGLFSDVKSESESEKYDLPVIIDNFDAAEKGEKPKISLKNPNSETKGKTGIKFTRIDKILLERITGVSLGIEAQEFAYCEKIETGTTEFPCFIKALMGFHGEYSRRAIMQILMLDFSARRGDELLDRKKVLNIYRIVLEKYCKSYNDIYMNVVKSLMKKYSKVYSLDGLEKMIVKKMDEIRRCNRMLALEIFTPRGVSSEDDFLEEIKIPKIVPSFWEYDRTDRKRYTCYLQRMREVDKALMRTIQKEIVNGNQKRYSSVN